MAMSKIQKPKGENQFYLEGIALNDIVFEKKQGKRFKYYESFVLLGQKTTTIYIRITKKTRIPAYPVKFKHIQVWGSVIGKQYRKTSKAFTKFAETGNTNEVEWQSYVFLNASIIQFTGNKYKSNEVYNFDEETPF